MCRRHAVEGAIREQTPRDGQAGLHARVDQRDPGRTGPGRGPRGRSDRSQPLQVPLEHLPRGRVACTGETTLPAHPNRFGWRGRALRRRPAADLVAVRERLAHRGADVFEIRTDRGIRHRDRQGEDAIRRRETHPMESPLGSFGQGQRLGARREDRLEGDVEAGRVAFSPPLAARIARLLAGRRAEARGRELLAPRPGSTLRVLTVFEVARLAVGLFVRGAQVVAQDLGQTGLEGRFHALREVLARRGPALGDLDEVLGAITRIRRSDQAIAGVELGVDLFALAVRQRARGRGLVRAGGDATVGAVEGRAARLVAGDERQGADQHGDESRGEPGPGGRGR